MHIRVRRRICKQPPSVNANDHDHPDAGGGAGVDAQPKARPKATPAPRHLRVRNPARGSEGLREGGVRWCEQGVSQLEVRESGALAVLRREADGGWGSGP